MISHTFSGLINTPGEAVPTHRRWPLGDEGKQAKKHRGGSNPPPYPMKPFFSSGCGTCLSGWPLFVKRTTWTAIFRAAASFMRCLDQNHSWFTGKAANGTFMLIKHKHENTGAGHIFEKCVLAPKPPYLNRTVPYKDDQVVIYLGIFSLIHFPVSFFFWCSSSTSTMYFDANNAMMTSFHQAPS